MTLNKYEFSFSDICIDPCEALRYSGVRGEADESCKKLFYLALCELKAYAQPRAVVMTLDVKHCDEGVFLGGDLIKSKSLSKFLQGCEKAAVFGATVGIGADRLISRYSMVSPSLAVMIDATASAAVEGLCDKLCCEILGSDKKHRFSPGYGDFPIEYQKRLVELLNTSLNIGVSLTNSLMLTPSKSVTAVVPM